MRPTTAVHRAPAPVLLVHVDQDGLAWTDRSKQLVQTGRFSIRGFAAPFPPQRRLRLLLDGRWVPTDAAPWLAQLMPSLPNMMMAVPQKRLTPTRLQNKINRRQLSIIVPRSCSGPGAHGSSRCSWQREGKALSSKCPIAGTGFNGWTRWLHCCQR